MTTPESAPKSTNEEKLAAIQAWLDKLPQAQPFKTDDEISIAGFNLEQDVPDANFPESLPMDPLGNVSSMMQAAIMAQIFMGRKIIGMRLAIDNEGYPNEHPWMKAQREAGNFASLRIICEPVKPE